MIDENASDEALDMMAENVREMVALPRDDFYAVVCHIREQDVPKDKKLCELHFLGICAEATELGVFVDRDFVRKYIGFYNKKGSAILRDAHESGRLLNESETTAMAKDALSAMGYLDGRIN